MNKENPKSVSDAVIEDEAEKIRLQIAQFGIVLSSDSEEKDDADEE